MTTTTDVPIDAPIIVTGLPRSGTSMMMQLLYAGGIPPLTDNIRKADESNTRGYFEYEPVKRTATDARWLTDARGKAVKVIYRLLYELPPHLPCRLILMHRPVDDVISSQQRMLKRRGETGASVSDEALGEIFRRELTALRKWAQTRPATSLLDVEYHAVLKSPRRESQRVAEFLGRPLQIDQMTQIVDPVLNHSRAQPAN